MISHKYILCRKTLRKMVADYSCCSSIYFPVKCNDNPVLLNEMKDLDIGFEVETVDQIRRLLRIGISPSRLLFYSSFSDRSTLRYAVNKGLSFFVIDNAETISLIDKICSNYKYLIRLRDDNVAKSRKVLGSSNEKVPEIINASHNGESFGFSFYLNAEINNVDTRIAMVDKAVLLFKAAGLKSGMINIGGGVKPEDCEQICNHLKKYGGYSIVVEPGRDMVNPCIDLLATVLAVDHDKNVAFLNVGIYNGLIDVLIKNRRFDVEARRFSNCRKSISYLLSGPTADSSDVIGEYVLPELKKGDQLLIKSCGAYSEVLSTSFYRYNKPKMIVD